VSDVNALLKLIRERHTPGTPALDQSSPTGKVCRGHGDWGYPPPWPCDLVVLADEIDRLRAKVIRHEPMIYDEVGEVTDEMFDHLLTRVRRGEQR